MAESKSSLIAKSVQKHAGRAKEKILQNLGKVDRTADEIFDEHLHNFTRQQNAANKLQKEFNNYIRCIRAVQTASKSLMESINEIYESQWPGHDLLCQQTQNIEMILQDFSHKLGDQVLIPLNTYQAQFPEMRQKKIDKRGRKLVDYDSQRHSFQSLQANPRKKDDVKVQRAKESLEEAKRTYEQLNSELHDELPALYDSRVLFLVTNLQTLFAAEQVFHSETAKAYNELEAIVDKLASECQRGPGTNSLKKAFNKTIANNIEKPTATNPGTLQRPVSPVESRDEDEKTSPNDEEPIVTATSSVRPTSLPLNNGVVNGNSSSADSNSAASNNKNNKNNAGSISPSTKRKKVEELYDIPIGATTDNVPPGVLYRVKATYKYAREDVDELSFEVGEIIRVVEYDDPEEQEEGWLMGVKESTGEKGMFPANFTRPI